MNFSIKCIFIALALLNLSSCAAADNERSLSTSQLHVEELLFPSGGVHDRYQIEPGPSFFCVDKPIKTEPRLRLSFVDHLAGSPKILRSAWRDPCEIKVSAANSDFIPDYTFSGCQWRFRGEGRTRIAAMNIASSQRAAIEKCFLRLNMILAGYSGAIDMDNELLFQPKSQSIWSTDTTMPDFIPRVPHAFFFCGFDKDVIKAKADIPSRIPCGKQN